MDSFYRFLSGRSHLSTLFAILLLGVLVLPLSAADSATIVDSGSTNTAGFQIDVKSSGEANYTPKPRGARSLQEGQVQPATRRIPTALTKRFFADLKRADLDTVAKQGCMKSASFGTTRTVEFMGHVSPDLSCGDRGNPKLKALIEDIEKIATVFRSDKSPREKAP